jgi:DNA polymerase-3 subunit alpha
MTVRYTHLHLHSEYSLVDSTIRIKALVAACVRDGIPAVALTDDSNMFALVKFYKACSAAGIKPIGGCDLWISSADDPRPWRLTLLCQNHDGYLNLSRLVSRAWQEGQRGGRALIDAGWLSANATHGLIALLGRDSEVARLALGQGNVAALARLRPLAQLFPAAAATAKRTGTPPRFRWPANYTCRYWPATMCVSYSRATSVRTKHACASTRAACWLTPSARANTATSNI